MDLVGIGVSVLDVLMVVDGLPREESVVRAERCGVGLGGGVAVAMATAARLGCQAALLDRLGHDHASDLIVEALQSSGVDVAALQRHDGTTASLANVWVDSASGSRTIVFAPGQDIDLTWCDVFETLVADAKVLHLSGRHAAASHRAIDVARRAGTLVSYDGGAHRYRKAIDSLFRRCNLAIVARQFAETFFRDTRHTAPPEPEGLARFLVDEIGCVLAGVTDGQRGSWFAGGDGDAFHQPAVAADPVCDTTGCGDVFHGAFLAGLVRGESFREAAVLAARVAAANAENLGALGFSAERFRQLGT